LPHDNGDRETGDQHEADKKNNYKWACTRKWDWVSPDPAKVVLRGLEDKKTMVEKQHKALLDERKQLALFEEQIDEKLENLKNLKKQIEDDLALLNKTKTQKEQAQEAEYEAKIRSKGGIGFFLGGIGPDGHIAFNTRGTDRFSTTRLTPTNFETQAVAAGDLGGIEISRNRLVITIGLETLLISKPHGIVESPLPIPIPSPFPPPLVT